MNNTNSEKKKKTKKCVISFLISSVCVFQLGQNPNTFHQNSLIFPEKKSEEKCYAEHIEMNVFSRFQSELHKCIFF